MHADVPIQRIFNGIPTACIVLYCNAFSVSVIKFAGRGGLPQGCLDIQEPCPDGSYPTGHRLHLQLHLIPVSQGVNLDYQHWR